MFRNPDIDIELVEILVKLSVDIAVIRVLAIVVIRVLLILLFIRYVGDSE